MDEVDKLKELVLKKEKPISSNNRSLRPWLNKVNMLYERFLQLEKDGKLGK